MISNSSKINCAIRTTIQLRKKIKNASRIGNEYFCRCNSYKFICIDKELILFRSSISRSSITNCNISKNSYISNLSGCTCRNQRLISKSLCRTKRKKNSTKRQSRSIGICNCRTCSSCKRNGSDTSIFTKSEISSKTRALKNIIN